MGTYASATPNSRSTWEESPTAIACASPVPSPPAPITTTVPSTVNARLLAVQRHRDRPVASNGSA
ncbi:MAG: hypothetical protein GEU96_18750 [Propionibacteriales bacterium]|nr:hypothetical protein [Propionibacteriales bacterium]